MNKLSVEKKMVLADLVIKKSVELFGFTPEEKSDENLKWMQENGYFRKKASRHRWDTDEKRR